MVPDVRLTSVDVRADETTKVPSFGDPLSLDLDLTSIFLEPLT